MKPELLAEHIEAVIGALRWAALNSCPACKQQIEKRIKEPQEQRRGRSCLSR